MAANKGGPDKEEAIERMTATAPSVLRESLQDLLREKQGAFAWSVAELKDAAITLVEHQIELKTGARPCR